VIDLSSLLPSILMMVAPILIAALGGMISERSGVVNIALEGLMGIGAFTGASVQVFLEPVLPGWSVVAALAAAALAGGLFSLIHAFASISLNADQTVSGTGINLLAMGTTVFFCQIFFNQDRSQPFQMGMITDSLGLYPSVWIALAVLAATWVFLYLRPIGLKLRSCGENPQAAAAAGIDVRKIRYLSVFLSGVLGGLAGACLILTQSIQYTTYSINGQGFIALAAVSFGRWLPGGVAAAAALFGTSVALAISMVNVSELRFLPPQFFSLIPYVLTIVTLVLFSGKDYAPRACGQPYDKGLR
jgi:general nucleoside transport system permease protein